MDTGITVMPTIPENAEFKEGWSPLLEADEVKGESTPLLRSSSIQTMEGNQPLHPTPSFWHRRVKVLGKEYALIDFASVIYLSIGTCLTIGVLTPMPSEIKNIVAITSVSWMGVVPVLAIFSCLRNLRR